MDVHSGGYRKEQYDQIVIEAPEDEATLIFRNRFGHDPREIACQCCGANYWIFEEEDKNVLDDLRNEDNVLFIAAKDITLEEKLA